MLLKRLGLKGGNSFKRIIVLFLLFFPVILFSQEANLELDRTLQDNSFIMEHLGQLAPMAINPYLTLFITSVLSKMGIHNDLVATNPLFGNYYVIIISFLLLLITSLPKFFSKLAAPIAITADYLNNKASVFITILIIALPSLINKQVVEDPIVYKAGFLSISLSTLTLMAVSTYYLIVVMSVRLFLEILIFLTPVPFLDAVFEICKWVFTFTLVLLGVFFPKFSLIITVVSFIVSLFFFSRAKRYITLIKCLVMTPVLKMITFQYPDMVDKSLPNSIEKDLGDSLVLAIPAITKIKLGSLKKGVKVWLTKSDQGILLTQKRMFLPDITESLDGLNLEIINNNIDIDIVSQDKTVSLVMSKFYRSLVPDISNLLRAKLKDNNFMASLKRFNWGFSASKEDKQEMKGIAG